MDAKSLTVEQRGAVRRQALRYREYLGKLVARMEALAWPADDRMRVATVQSRDAVEAMLKALDAAEPPAPFLAHYRAAEPGEPPAERGGLPDTAALPWVGKRKAGRRR